MSMAHSGPGKWVVLTRTCIACHVMVVDEKSNVLVVL